MSKIIKVAMLILLVTFLIKPSPVKAASTLTIKVGATPGLYCGSYYDDGYNKKWVSSNPSIVSVTSNRGANCTIVAKSIGECDVTFYCNYQRYEVIDYENGKPVFGYVPYAYSYNYHIKVIASGDSKVGTIHFVSDYEALLEGNSRILDYEMKDIDGNMIYNYNKLSWSSSNPKVATVNKIGEVTAWSKGKAVITAKSPDGGKDTCTVTVGPVTGFTTIASAQDLHKIRYNLSGKYILTKDIIFNDKDFTIKGSFYNSGSGWLPIDGFSGILEGNGHSIVNLHSKGSDAGLFTNLTGTIRNLEIKNSSFTGTKRAGAFAAYATFKQYPDYQVLIHCTSTNNKITAPTAGGLVGECFGRSNYNQCTNTSMVIGNTAAGGIIGKGGGFSIYLMCSNKGSITIGDYATGSFGGLTGIEGNSSIYKYCWNKGTVSGKGKIGGLIGHSYIGSRLFQSYNNGKVVGSSSSSYVGGIAGQANRTYIEDCYNLGNLELTGTGNGKGLLGGIIATYNLSGYQTNENHLFLNNCINLGSIKNNCGEQVKGGSILATVVGDAYIGNQIVVNNCYYLSSTYHFAFHTLFVGTVSNIKPLSTTQMKAANNFKGFDFNRIWEMKKGASYPTLTYQSEISKSGILLAPGSLKVVNKSYSSAKLSWSAAEHATGYEIYRSTSKNGTYKLLTRVSSASYTNTKLTTGTQYYYKVRAYCMVGQQKKYSSFSPIIAVKPSLATPKGCKTAKIGSTSIELTWGKVSGASGYEVYSSTSKKGKYTKLKTTTSRTYTKKGLKKKKTYYYKIRAYRKVAKKKVYSGWSTIIYRKL